MNDVKMCRRNEELQSFYLHPTTGSVDVRNCRGCQEKLVSVVSCNEFLFCNELTRNKYQICNLFSEQEPNNTQLLQAQQARQFSILQKYA
jgi:hypothetical protein